MNTNLITAENNVKGLLNKCNEPVGIVSLKDSNNTKVPGFVGIKNKTTKRVVSVVNETYNLLPNTDVVEPVLEQFEKTGVKYEVDALSWVSDQRMQLHLKLPDYHIKDDSKEGLISSLWLHNSYNMTESARLMAGAFRLVCSNGMIVGEMTEKISLKHQAKQIRAIMTGHTISVVESIEESITNTQERIQELIDEKVTAATLFDIFHAFKFDSKLVRHFLTELGVVTAETRTKEFEEVLGDIKTTKKFDQNMYDLYNMLTYFVSHMKDPRYRVSYLERISKRFAL